MTKFVEMTDIWVLNICKQLAKTLHLKLVHGATNSQEVRQHILGREGEALEEMQGGH